MIITCVVFSGIYFNKCGLEISPQELIDLPKPIDVWNESSKYLGKVIRVWRNSDHCLECLIDDLED